MNTKSTDRWVTVTEAARVTNRPENSISNWYLTDKVVRHKRQKYRCRCGAGIETALGPDKLVAGGRYSIDFAVDVPKTPHEVG